MYCLPDSIKKGPRIKRARGTKGIGRIIEGRAVKLTDNWNSFICSRKQSKYCTLSFRGIGENCRKRRIFGVGWVGGGGGGWRKGEGQDLTMRTIQQLLTKTTTCRTSVRYTKRLTHKQFYMEVTRILRDFLIFVCKDIDVILMLCTHFQCLPEQVGMKTGTSDIPENIKRIILLSMP